MPCRLPNCWPPPICDDPRFCETVSVIYSYGCVIRQFRALKSVPGGLLIELIDNVFGEPCS